MKSRIVSGLVSLGVLTGCASTHAQMPHAGIDHVVLAISNLERGIGQLHEICGMKPVHGGAHEDTGTENALMSLNARGYLEVLAPRNGAVLPPELQPLHGVSSLLPASWAVSVGNADLTAQLLRAHGYDVGDPKPGSRKTADGSVVRWRTVQLAGAKIAGAPFFIEWERDAAHPATTSPRGCPLLALELHTPQDAELRRLVALVNVQAEVIRADEHRMVVVLLGADGPTRLPAGD